jgi:antitoxin component of MazEF toxin-antitoxin module
MDKLLYSKYCNYMIVRITRIGNSRDIRIPKHDLDLYQLNDGDELELESGPNAVLETVVVCPLTSTIHERSPSRVQTATSGKPAEVAVDQIRTVAK